MTRTYEIVKRAYGERTHYEYFTGTWCDAMNREMALGAEKHDGEYFAQEVFASHVREWNQMQPVVNVWN